ncbi:MAG TPA: MFS transporter, partial [Lachnospiraceae bacterium]|nr:MFS transporter [Lachnospiraceae bacterium]
MKAEYRLGYIVFLSLVAAIGGLLFGYDTAVISGTVDQVTEQFSLTVMEQGWFVGCALIGSIIGV